MQAVASQLLDCFAVYCRLFESAKPPDIAANLILPSRYSSSSQSWTSKGGVSSVALNSWFALEVLSEAAVGTFSGDAIALPT